MPRYRRCGSPPAVHVSEVDPMTISFVVLQPLVALIAGILILLIPRLLHIIVGVYLVAVGLLGLWPHFMLH
jgi:Protein of unknown function (DUF3096)